MKTKGVPLIIFALVLALLSPAAGAFCLGDTVLDSVNIGDPASESGHSLTGWTDRWECGPSDPNPPGLSGDWCACHDTTDSDGVGDMRLIWGESGACPDGENWASVTLDAGEGTATLLKVEHLDGAGNDGFEIYINDNYVGTYTDAYDENTWVWDDFALSGGYSGELIIKFVATGPAWSGCPTYGQVAFNRIELKAPAITINLEDIDSGLTSPTGEYRWRDVADQLYGEDYRTNYNYTQASVQVTYYPVANTLHGTLTATNLKPNFAYQLKLVGFPETAPDSNEQTGLTGRWWEQEWNGSEWTNGWNLNNKGDGSSPNPNDLTYFSRRDIADATSPTGLHYRYTGYLVFDYFVTDEEGNAVLNFDQDSCYHVLWKTSQRGRGANDGPLKTATFDADDSAAYDDTGGDDYPSQTVEVFGEWERLPMGGVYLPEGDYLVQIMLTEESFHGSGGANAGNWAAAMGAEIEFTIVPESATAPIVGDIPDQAIAEGESFVSINLDDYVTDADNTPDQMTWTYSGNSELSVTIADRVATVSVPDADWNGSETITFTATDPEDQSDSDYATFTVTPVNDLPIVGDVADQTIAEGESFVTINLDDYVSDVDNTDAEMTWTYSGNSELSVTIADRVATISTPDADWTGSETITFTATDPGDAGDSDDAMFTVTPVNDAPVVDDIPDQTIAPGESFVSINLDDYASDVDNTDAEMTWTYSGNSELSVTIADRVATVSVPYADWIGSETITFTATDPEGASDGDEATFTSTVLGYGTIQGIVEVQGRSGDWDGAEITVSGGPGGTYNTTVTNPDGTWSISGVLAGTYQVEVEMARHLDGLKTEVTVSSGGTTDVGQVKVLGGDCNDSDGPPDFTYGIDILDAGITGNAFGSVPTDPNWDARADINADGKVNILDTVLVGGNWHKCSPVNWP